MLTSQLIGQDNFMWASDFPHRASTWPNSRAIIEQNFADVSDEIKRKITYETIHRLYGF